MANTPPLVPAGVTAIRMPKWGLSMDEGQVVLWHRAPGDRVAEGDDLVEIETSKITNVFEAPNSGLLRRIVAAEGETVAVGALIAALAEETVDDEVLDAFIADFAAAFVPGEGDEESEERASERIIEIDDYRINIGQVGSGTRNIVLIHGFSGNWSSWGLSLGQLAELGRVTAIDLPGHGASSKAVGDGTAGSLAAAVSDALDTLDLTDVHLIGHSLGAAVALRVAARRGDCRSLVLVAPAGLPGSTVDRDFLDTIVDGQRARDLKPALETLFHDPALVSSEMVEDMVRYKRIDDVEDALAAIRDRLVDGSAALPDQDVLAQLPPTLVVLGETDRIIGQPDTGQLPAGWRIETLLAAGHMPHVERAGDFNRLVADFLTQQS